MAALEQYAYCPDLVDQGTKSLAALAATLQDAGVWYAWWDCHPITNYELRITSAARHS
jgi:hypothetical protein